MIAVAVSILAGIYLLLPSLLFDKLLDITVPAKKNSRGRTDEFFHSILVVLLPFLIVWITSHICFWFGNYPFHLSALECSKKSDDYHRIILALSSDTYFSGHSDEVWSSVYRARHHQERFLLWFYVVLILQAATLICVLKNFGNLMRNFWFRGVISKIFIGRVSEWHILFTTFLFDPSEERTVYADILTSDGLYKGKVRNHFVHNDGTLRGILLEDAYRFRKKEYDFARDRQEKPKVDDFWKKIRGGTHLYIPGNQIGNLNVRYQQPTDSVEKELTDFVKLIAGRLSAGMGESKLTVTLKLNNSQSDESAGTEATESKSRQ